MLGQASRGREAIPKHMSSGKHHIHFWSSFPAARSTLKPHPGDSPGYRIIQPFQKVNVQGDVGRQGHQEDKPTLTSFKNHAGQSQPRATGRPSSGSLRGGRSS